LKKILIILLFAFSILPCFANLEACFKSYQRPADEMFLLSVAALNKNRYEILEMQSQSGYILFRAFAKDYLLTVSNKTGGTSIKIVPSNSNFSSGVSVQAAVFSTLDSSLPEGFKRIL